MSLLQIDLGPERRQHVVGIDLGTTNSLVAYIDENGTPTIIDENGDGIVPSVVTVLEDGRIVVGREAKQHLLSDTERTAYSVKRLMGKSYADLERDTHLLSYRLAPRREGLVRVELAGVEYTPIELSSMILKELKARAERHFNGRVNQAVITVPAYFNDAQRQATKDAGKLAGLDVLRIVNEPTAAALAYGLDREKKGTVAVYDLGGGTFDISILRLEGGVYQVLATNGDTYLGGDDIDQAIMGRIGEELRRDHGIETLTPTELQQVRDAAERAKQKLSDVDETTIELNFTDRSLSVCRRFTRAELEELAAPVVARTEQRCLAALTDAGLGLEEIDAVVLVGGSTRMPLVREMARRIFGREPYSDFNPDEVVALGAAVQADVLGGNRKDTLLLDVVPLSLGIETVGGVMSTLIMRNTTIPTQVTEMYTTWVDNQTGININVYQGEREFVRDNRHLAGFTLGPLPALPAGMPKIEVAFLIDADGILRVRATDLRTGAEQLLDVKPSYGLTDDEVERMLRESIELAQKDIGERILVEARTEAESLIRAAQKVIEKHPELVEETEARMIVAAITTLESAIPGEDQRLIRDLTTKLEETTEPLAQRVMNSTVQSELLEKKIGDV